MHERALISLYIQIMFQNVWVGGSEYIHCLGVPYIDSYYDTYCTCNYSNGLILIMGIQNN